MNTPVLTKHIPLFMHGRMWLHAPHPDLGGRTPLSYLEAQKIETLEQRVEMAELGQMG